MLGFANSSSVYGPFERTLLQKTGRDGRLAREEDKIKLQQKRTATELGKIGKQDDKLCQQRVVATKADRHTLSPASSEIMGACAARNTKHTRPLVSATGAQQKYGSDKCLDPEERPQRGNFPFSSCLLQNLCYTLDGRHGPGVLRFGDCLREGIGSRTPRSTMTGVSYCCC